MTERAWFGRVDKTHDTGHVVGAKPEEVFGDGIEAAVAARIFPLLTVDADDLDLELSGRFHFLYTELETLHFRRDGDLYLSVDDYASVRRFYEGQKPWTPVAEWHGRSVQFERLVLPERAADEDDYDYADRLAAVAEASSAIGEIRIGGPPLWVQSPSVPEAADGSPMQFIGQIVATALTDHAADAALYLFHDPAADRITQVSQFT